MSAGTQLGNSQLHPPGYFPHMVTARISVQLMSCHFFLFPESLSLFLCHQSFSPSQSPPCFISPSPQPHHTMTRFLRRVHLVQSWLSMRPLPSSVSLWKCGNGRGLDKWDSAVLLLIIMPRLSLTDTRDLSSATQTCISPLAAQCVHA